MCVTDCRDMTLAVKVALKPKYNQPQRERERERERELCSYYSNYMYSLFFVCKQEIDVDDVSFVKESLDRLPFVPSLSFLRQEFLVGPKTYFQIVGTMLLHKKLLSETEKRHAIYNFPGFCSGCIRMGLCYGCERSSEPQ